MIGLWIFVGAFALYCIGWIVLGPWSGIHPEVNDLGEWERIELDEDNDNEGEEQ